MSLTDSAISNRIKQRARELGFDLVGIAPARPSDYRDYLRAWLTAGYAGDMHFLEQRFAERVDPSLYLPGVKSVICVAASYHTAIAPLPPGHARIARYTQGDDYHAQIKPKLYDLADWIRDTFPGAQTRSGTDSAPIMEREYAARAGLGWVGKNTCIINPRAGSWLLLGEVLTTLDLPADAPETDHCGTCTRCIDACPTDAITGPYQLNASRCISYLTIEHSGDIPADLQGKMGDWLIGCDICQDVCPHNNHAPLSQTPWLQPRIASNSVDPHDVLNWTLEDYHVATRRSAMRRVKLPQFQRNARIVIQNQEKE